MLSSGNSFNILKQMEMGLNVLHTNMGVFLTFDAINKICLRLRYNVHKRVVCTHSVSDVGVVKGEIAFLGPLLHFKGLAQGLCDVCFERIAFCLLGFWRNY